VGWLYVLHRTHQWHYRQTANESDCAVFEVMVLVVRFGSGKI
jgi:hypothetical protein